MRSRALAVLSFGVVFGAQAAELAGVRLDDEIRIGEERLVLNGAGVRKRLFFSVNVVGLYLPEPKRSAEDILAAPGSKRVTLVMLRDVSADQFVDAFHAALEANTPGEESKRLQPQITAFEALLREVKEVKKGDVVHLDYRPNTGTQLILNGVPRGKVIEGEDFYRALLRNWLGPNPADADLKNALIGAQ